MCALLVLAAATPLAAKPDKGQPKGDDIKDMAEALEAALKKGDAAGVTQAITNAADARAKHQDAQFAGFVKVLAKGLEHKDAALAAQCAEAIGQLKVKGSAKVLDKLLAPPAKLKDERLPVHIAAFKAAGVLAEPESLKELAKALTHPVHAVGVAAAEALAGYKSLEAKAKKALLGDIVDALEKLEKLTESAKDEDKDGLVQVAGAVNAALAALTGGTHTTSDEWNAYLKERAKE
jgi:hypothetical protein